MKITIEETLKLGVESHKEGKFEDAERHYRAILETQPTHSDANHNLGVLAVDVGKFSEALPFLEKAVNTNRNQEQYWVSLINVLIKLGKIHDARKVLSAALKIGFEGDKIKSISLKLNPSTKLEFFYTYLKTIGVFDSQKDEVLNGESEAIPLLTTSFLNWFETQKWSSMSLLEFGAGGSTLYFSQFFKSVTSYETDQSWFDKLLLKIPSNVNLIKVNSIIKALRENNIKNIHSFDVILIDAGENRAKLTRWLINENYKGIIFFDNSEWYRKSIGIFLKEGFLEIPFFGLKPTQDRLSCTSILAEPKAIKDIFKGNWISFPKLTRETSYNSWDNENS